jgi:hypothetical protein
MVEHEQGHEAHQELRWLVDRPAVEEDPDVAHHLVATFLHADHELWGSIQLREEAVCEETSLQAVIAPGDGPGPVEQSRQLDDTLLPPGPWAVVPRA